MKTTVLIPLHASRPWRDALVALITELRDHAALVVSDATGLDDTLEHLREAAGTSPDIQWLGPRPLAPGWRAHANDLLASVSTPYAMWLSHDDRISADWILAAEAALAAHPQAIGACGPIRPWGDDPLADIHHIDVPAFVELADSHSRMLAAITALLIGRPADLGMLYRSVLRTAEMPLLPHGLDGDAWSDVLWALRLLERGALVRMDAYYEKQWHESSAHSQWPPWPTDSHDMRRTIMATLESPSIELILDAWEIDRHQWQRALEQTRIDERAAAADALAGQRHAYESSRSWRITAPLRRGRRRQSDTPPK